MVVSSRQSSEGVPFSQMQVRDRQVGDRRVMKSNFIFGFMFVL